MKTAHFLDADLPVVDGVIRIARAYRDYMEQHLGPSWLVVPYYPGAPSDTSRRIAFPSIPLRTPYRLGMPSLAPTLERRVTRSGFDVLHSHSPFSAGRVAVAASRTTRRPMVFTLHSRYPDWMAAQYKRDPRWLTIVGAFVASRRPRVHRADLRDLFQVTERGLTLCIEATQRVIWRYCLDVQVVLVASETARRELQAYALSCHERERAQRSPEIRVIHNGIDFPERARGAVKVRERHGLPPGVPLFLFVGQLAIEKEVEFLLEALGALRRSGQDFRCLLVGEGPDAGRFELLAKLLGIADVCTFVGKITDKAQLADYYAQADLFLFPSLYETLGLVAMEAASFGLPTVAHRGAPGLSEVFRNGATAFFADRTPAAYAQTILELLRHPEKARAVGESAKGVVRRSDKAAAEVASIYRELVRGESSPSARSVEPTYRVAR